MRELSTVPRRALAPAQTNTNATQVNGETSAFWPLPAPPRQIPADRYDEWRLLVTDQHGVISRAQALRLGLTSEAIRAQVTACRWRRVLHGVYATFTGPLPRPAQQVAALFYAGAPAMLSHRTAAEEWGMIPIAGEEPIEVTVPYGRNATSNPPAVLLHRSRAFSCIATANGAQPRTSRADTIIDLATSEPTAQDAKLRLVDLVGRTPVSVHAVAQQLLRRPPFRYRAALSQGIELIHGGALSALEAEYAERVEREHSLPAGSRQVPFSVDGRILWEDVAYDETGAPLTVRLDGRTWHASPGVAFRDRRRDNAAELANRSRLMYGWAEVTDDPCGVAAEVLTVLARLGWAGRPRPCESPQCTVASAWPQAS